MTSFTPFETEVLCAAQSAHSAVFLARTMGVDEADIHALWVRNPELCRDAFDRKALSKAKGLRIDRMRARMRTIGRLEQ